MPVLLFFIFVIIMNDSDSYDDCFNTSLLLTYVLIYLLTYILTYLLTYLLTHSLHVAESLGS